jgi:hypothetical protein
MTKEKHLEKEIIGVNKKSMVSMKSISEGYENPKIFVS